MTSTTAPPDPPGEPGVADLIGYGRISWDQFTAMVSGATAAWADYTGFHIAPPPGSPPPYTHLWAWTSQWLARARIDNGTAIAGVLALAGLPQHAPPVQSRDTVRFQHLQGATWPRTEKRVGQLPPEIAGHPVDIYLIPGKNPITFITAATPALADPSVGGGR